MARRSDDLLLNRIHDANGLNVDDFKCVICQDLLWKPVECINCHNFHCKECIQNWLRLDPEICPHCRNYKEGPSHPMLTRQLSRLQLSCIHRNNGCPEILPYEALEKHEGECDYSYEQCRGCRAMILRKNLQQHEDDCGSIKLTCPDCGLAYVRSDAHSHSETKCLQEQLLQRDLIIGRIRTEFDNYRDQQTAMMKKLTDKLDQLETRFEEKEITSNINNDASCRIPNLIPPSGARWVTNAVTVAGGHGQGDGTHQLNGPCGLFVDENQTIYIADLANHRIISWKKDSSTGQVVAGGNGQGDRLNQLNSPTDVLLDSETNSFIICDRDNQRVVRWPRLPSFLRQPEVVINNISCSRLMLDNQSNLYISDWRNNVVKRYDKFGDKRGTVVAGVHGLTAGPNLSLYNSLTRLNNPTQLKRPTHLFCDPQSNLYVSSLHGNCVLKWTKGSKQSVVVAGGNDQGGNLTQLSSPRGVWVDASENVYVSDSQNHRVVRWEKGARQGTVIVGGNGDGTQSNQLSSPGDLFFDLQGHLYVSDWGNHRVQRFSLIID